MEMRTLGKDGPTVSAIGFGGMPLSIELTGFPRPDEATSIAVIHAVLDAGVTLLDTADVYSSTDAEVGHNERLFRKALATWSGDRDRIVVATKGGLIHPERMSWQRDGRPEHLRLACDRSLQALGVDRIDLWQLHGPDPKVPWEDMVGTAIELRDAGKIRWIGLSNVGVDRIDRASEMTTILTVQNELSVFFRASSKRRRLVLPSILDRCRKLGIGFLAHSPLGGAARNARLLEHPVLGEIAARHRASRHAVALAWVSAQGDHVFPLPAARTIPHALDSIGSAALRLSSAELDAIRRGAFA